MARFSLLFLLLLAACVERPAHTGNAYPVASGTREYKATHTNMKSASLRQHSSQPGQFRQWVDSDPQYHLLPGDQLSVYVYSAPELNQTLIVGPDGRVSMPLADHPIMAANLTVDQLEQHLRVALSRQLVDPTLEITPKAFGSQRIFIGGEVGKPGIYELPGQIGVTEAVMMAGGFTTSARSKQVVLVRRHPSGAPMMKVINVNALLHHGAASDVAPLRCGDVIFVPRSTIANINLFMQQYIRDAIPVTFGFYYDVAQAF